jgi:hypothetical protein
MDEDGLTLEHVAESMGLRPEIRIEQNSDDGGDPDLPTLEDIKKSMGLGRKSAASIHFWRFDKC